MKIPFTFLMTALIFVQTEKANALFEPELNECSMAHGMIKCEVICKRSLGDQCLITQINFEGANLKPKTKLIRAKFKTCKNANLDFQISSLAIELQKLEPHKSEAKVSAKISASGKSISLDNHTPILFDNTKIDGQLPRTYFKEFINSGESFVEANINLEICGRKEGSNSCKLYGTLIAVTDPNIRCDFHDTTKPGAYRPANLQLSPNLQNSQQPVGRIGQ